MEETKCLIYEIKGIVDSLNHFQEYEQVPYQCIEHLQERVNQAIKILDSDSNK